MTFLTTSSRRRRAGAAFTAATALAAISACTPGFSSTDTSSAPTEASAASAPALLSEMPATPGETAALLATLPIRPEDTGAHYDRDDWKHWVSQPGTGPGCDTREMVLLDQGVHLTAAGYSAITYNPKSCAPDVGGGNTWTSLYDNESITDPRELDVDHWVPLEQMARSHTRDWTAAQRQAYANDPEILIAVTARSNRQKGSQDPARWMPSAAAAHCEYVRVWVYAKAKYSRLTGHPVSVDQAEHDAIASVLRRCPEGT